MIHDYIQLKNALHFFGFSKKEADVYIAILEIGKGTVSTISRKAAINRTTGYDILNSLSSKGLVSISGKEPKQEYTAESPNNIIDLLKRQSELVQKQIKLSEEIIPEMSALLSSKNRPRIRFYEGEKGLKHVYEDTLTSTETIKAFATVDDMHKALPNYFPKYYKRRAEKNINIEAIVPETEFGIERSKKNKEERRKISFVPADKYYFSPEINIYENKIMIASWREKLGIIIESNEIADALKKIHELAWLGSKTLNK
jgi:sugar-specific transcriptional regulator TrmB